MQYDAVYTFAHALHNLLNSTCPDNPDRKCIQGPELLNSMKSLTFEGVSGTIKFDKNGDRQPRYELLHYFLDENETLTILPVGFWDQVEESMIIHVDKLKWRDSGDVNTTQSHFINQTLIPASFCSSACKPKQYKVQLSPICCWDCRWCRSNEQIVENGTTCEACPPFFWPDNETALTCIPLGSEYIKWSDKSSIILISVSSMGILMVGLILIIIWRNRNARLIKATNKEQSCLIFFGILLALASIFVFIHKPTDTTCLAREILFHITVSLLYAPLFVKVLRIYCIFRSGKKGKKSTILSTLGLQRLMTAFIILPQVL